MKIHERRWIELGPSHARADLWTGAGYPTFDSKPYAGKCSASSRIIPSRVTLATHEAAATASDVASPLITVVQREPSRR
jgi:hypothetical protein